MNITLTDLEVRAAIKNYLEALHVVIPTDTPFMVEVDSQGTVSAKIEGATFVFAPDPAQRIFSPPPSLQVEEAVAEDLSGFNGPEGNLGVAIEKQHRSWAGRSSASTSLSALGKQDPSDYMDEIGEPVSNRY